jgi:hypothetical protein
MRTNQTELIVALADAYIAASGCKTERAASVRIFDHTAKLEQLRAGTTDLGTERYNRTLRWFADHWPKGHEPPPEIKEGLEQCARLVSEIKNPELQTSQA